MAELIAAPVGPRSRHFLIDSNVFIKERVNLDSRLFNELKAAVEEFDLVLHFDLLILFEVTRWLTEQMEEMAREQRKNAKHIESWNKRFPLDAVAIGPSIDVSAAVTSVRSRFVLRLLWQYRAVQHDLDTIELPGILERYMARQAPFEARESKEFPDAFIVDAARTWAWENNADVHIVTLDEAMLAHAGSTPMLVPVKGLPAFLAMLAEAKDPEVVALIDRIVDEQDFIDQLFHRMDVALRTAEFVYRGTSLEAATVDGTELREIGLTENWKVLSVHGPIVAMTARFQALVGLEVDWVGQIEDEDGGRAHGRDEWDDEVKGRFFVQYDRLFHNVVRVEILTSLDFGEPYDEYDDDYFDNDR
ncbi:PIN domain-containing protein [Aureimonas sp. AU40]|uniref:PIN domain-containing protein n=1 Tax=Aureimonas sp. AU40 TaxID=1637747 RepID=UPI0012E36A64|nr:PIN domain-containing protein [Aureimonas sp. AU40]